MGDEEKILEKIKENSMGIRISRVPPKTKEAFIFLANEEFCGDFGMTLKWLMDDILSQDTRLILESLRNHEERLLRLENPIPIQKDERSQILADNEKRMLNGSIIKVKT